MPVIPDLKKHFHSRKQVSFIFINKKSPFEAEVKCPYQQRFSSFSHPNLVFDHPLLVLNEIDKSFSYFGTSTIEIVKRIG